MSVSDQAAGVTLTEEKTPVLSWLLLLESTAKPARTVVGMFTVTTPPTCVQLTLLRFPQQASGLAETLRQIDAELAAEAAEFASARVSRGDKEFGVKESKKDSLLSYPPVFSSPVVSVSALLETLRSSQVLTAAQMEDLMRSNSQGHFADPKSLARELLRRDWLTPFQANRLLNGQGHQLVLRPYLLLGRLGAGGGGQVSKARHLRLNRLVALKVLREDLLADPEVIARFYREIQLISQLHHPNVVHAYDAGLIGGTPMLVMEYIEGIDLSRLVKESGQLPVEQACSCVRQAALGLDHVHRLGLVHRDIKPSNLLVNGTKTGIMFRDGLAANAANVFLWVAWNGQIGFQYRSAAGQNTNWAAGTTAYPPKWLKLVRMGNKFTAHYSNNGQNWTKLGNTVTVAMSNAVNVGLVVCSLNNSELATAKLVPPRC